MTMRVLVFDCDTTLTTAVARCLQAAGVEVVELHRACDVVDFGSAFDLALVDWRFSTWADELGARRVVMMLSYADATVEREISERFTTIRKPFTSVELLSVIHHELGVFIRGPQPLVDALRVAHSERRSLSIVPTAAESDAVVHVIRGEVVDASFGALRGEDALCALLRMTASVREKPTTRVPWRTVSRPFRELLFDLLVRIDDDERARREAAS